MTKIHYEKTGVPACGAEPYGPKPGDVIYYPDGHEEIVSEYTLKPLPITTEWTKVTCKNCAKKKEK